MHTYMCAFVVIWMHLSRCVSRKSKYGIYIRGTTGKQEENSGYKKKVYWVHLVALQHLHITGSPSGFSKKINLSSYVNSTDLSKKLMAHIQNLLAQVHSDYTVPEYCSTNTKIPQVFKNGKSLKSTAEPSTHQFPPRITLRVGKRSEQYGVLQDSLWADCMVQIRLKL